MSAKFLANLNAELNSLKDAGLYKSERVIASRQAGTCLLYTSPSPRDGLLSRMPSSA